MPILGALACEKKHLILLPSQDPKNLRDILLCDSGPTPLGRSTFGDWTDMHGRPQT